MIAVLYATFEGSIPRFLITTHEITRLCIGFIIKFGIIVDVLKSIAFRV